MEWMWDFLDSRLDMSREVLMFLRQKDDATWMRVGIDFISEVDLAWNYSAGSDISLGYACSYGDT